MEVQPGNSSDDEKQRQRQQQPNFEKIKSLYSNYLSAIFHSLNSNFIHKLSSFFRPSSPRRRKPSLPLPLPFESVHFNPSSFSPSKMFDVLENILEHVLLNLHVIQKNLLFWETRAEGSAARKAYFMLFERGPRALIGETFRTVKECGAEGSWTDSLSDSAYIHIAERITFFNKLRHCLATFLAQVYMEVDKFGGELIKEPEKTLPLLLTRVNDLFSKLETSIQNVQTMHWKDSSADGSSTPLLFEKLPEVNQEGSQWTESEVRDAINLIYRNLQKLDSHLSFLIAKHKKPNKVTLYWIHYTLGIAGVSFCSMWLIRHSRLAGSSDIDNWICDAKDSTVSFWNDHVEQPIISIRDELFNTFRKRHKGVMEFEEVQLTATSLHRMLLAFSQKTGGQNIPENTPDQEMLEIVMARYEKELMHPIQNLVAGELARALLIQIQKLKLDIETAMLELDQILKANEINFAVLAALPAFFLSLGLIMGVRTWLRKDTKAEGRGRIARLQRRLLLVDVEKGLMKYQLFLDQGLEKDAECMFGLMLYSLDRLYRAVEGNAKATGEWLSLSQDIMELGKPDLPTPYKMAVTSRMERLYDCLLPSLMHK